MTFNRLIVIFALMVLGVSSLKRRGKCQPINIPFCGNMPYSRTVTPNFLNHRTQTEAMFNIETFWPPIRFSCSAEFLCALYAPLCIKGRALPPCRSLCESAMMECARTPLWIESSLYPNFTWPEYTNCTKYPDQSDGKITCVDQKVLSDYSRRKEETRAYTKRDFEKMLDDELLVFNAMSLQQLRQDNAKLREMLGLQAKVDQLSKSIGQTEIRTKQEFERMLETDVLVFSAMTLQQLLRDNAELLRVLQEKFGQVLSTSGHKN